jgi:hypothetical protein
MKCDKEFWGIPNEDADICPQCAGIGYLNKTTKGAEMPTKKSATKETTAMVDALTKIARQISDLGNAGANTEMGAIEAHGVALRESVGTLSESIHEVAQALQEIATAVRSCNG